MFSKASKTFEALNNFYNLIKGFQALIFQALENLFKHFLEKKRLHVQNFIII